MNVLNCELFTRQSDGRVEGSIRGGVMHSWKLSLGWSINHQATRNTLTRDSTRPTDLSSHANVNLFELRVHDKRLDWT